MGPDIGSYMISGISRYQVSTFSGLAIANVLGTGVQLIGDGLDPEVGRLEVVETSRLAAAGGAAHAGKAPMDTTLASSGWHWGFKCGLGDQDGFKLETGDEV